VNERDGISRARASSPNASRRDESNRIESNRSIDRHAVTESATVVVNADTALRVGDRKSFGSVWGGGYLTVRDSTVLIKKDSREKAKSEKPSVDLDAAKKKVPSCVLVLVLVLVLEATFVRGGKCMGKS